MEKHGINPHLQNGVASENMRIPGIYVVTWMTLLFTSNLGEQLHSEQKCDNGNDQINPSASQNQYRQPGSEYVNIVDNPNVDNSVHNTLASVGSGVVKDDIPIIMWWTGRLLIENDIHRIVCKEHTCYSTNLREYVDDPRTRILWFYGTDLQPEDLPFPRQSHHEWALFHEESPMNNYMLSHTSAIHLFNHTATFKRESDFPLTTQHIPSLNYLTSRQPLSVAKKNELKIKKGLAPVLYVQSHCNVASDRDRYVQELMNYIPVDSLGSCLNNKELPKNLRDPVESMESNDFLDYISQYKFHISFENANCNDYMTEKLFRPLHVGSVPVYKGSSLAEDWMPDKHSVIMADHFTSPKELGEFLLHLDRNDEEYEKYLQFKKANGVSNKFLVEHLQFRKFKSKTHKKDMLPAFECHLCKLANERTKREKEHTKNPSIPLLPPKIATREHLYCPQPYVSFGDLDDYPAVDR